jgi:type VI protein secretion system component VasF
MSTPAGGSPAGDRPRDSRATTWMVIAGVLALVAIGLGIWAFTIKSDLDDANAEIDDLNRQRASEQQAAGSEEARLQAFGERERAAFRRVRRRFIREEAEARNLKATIEKEAGELDQARNEADSAETQEQKDRAALKEARQNAQLASACVQGAVTALDRFFDAASAKAGANAAVAELQSIQDQCTKANE